RAGYDFLSGARRAQHKHRRVRRSDQLDLLHDGAQTRFRADDGVRDVVPAQSGQERAVFGFYRLTQTRQLAQATIIFQGDGKRIKERAEQSFVFRLERMAGTSFEEEKSSRSF